MLNKSLGACRTFESSAANRPSRPLFHRFLAPWNNHAAANPVKNGLGGVDFRYRRPKSYRLLAVICTVLGLSGCAGVAPEAYRGQTPTLDLATYFNGPLTAWGYFADRSGEVKRRFTVDMTGVWQGNEGVLTEHFDWSDGEKSQRIWRITKLDDHRYIGRADDVKGEASGTAYGNALQWKYTLLLPVDGKTYEVQFDDWMYLMNDSVMLNKSEMRKFGFKLGEIVISFRRGP